MSYQLVFNGAKMVYRKVDQKKKRGGAVASVIQTTPIQAPVEATATKPVDPKALRARIAADLMRSL